MAKSPKRLIESWVAEPQNTARSVLVTIFGDTVVPVTTEVWLAQLFKLTEVFEFSDRLVRTSMFRLTAEGWFTNERVGRQSRYSMTPLAIEESKEAATRIYGSPQPDWSGQWTVAFLDSPGIDENQREQLTQHLRWHGFIKLSRAVLASPGAALDQTRDLAKRIEPDVRLPLAAMEFADLEGLVSDGFFNEALAVEDLAKAYREFIALYGPLVDKPVTSTPLEAFALRTMMIHDLRRIRLSGPDIPAEVLPSDWVGETAMVTAAALYDRLSHQASDALSQILETQYPTEFPTRFVA